MKNKEFFGTLLVIFAAVISGIAIPLNKIFVVSIDPTVFTAIRAVLVGLVFLLISFRTHGVSKKLFKHDWKYIALIAVIGGALAFLLFFTGLKFTTAGRAAFLHKTLPIYAALFAFIFLKERVTKNQLYALALMLVGTVVIFSAQINPAELWMDPQFGDALVIGATVLWALENVFAKKLMKDGANNFVVSFSRMFFGGLILFGAVILNDKMSAIYSLNALQWNNIFISVVVLFGYVLFWYWGLRYTSVTKASSLLLIAPIVSALAGLIWLGEPMPAVQLLGSSLILIGAYFTATLKSEVETAV